MAPSISNAKFISAFLLNRVSVSATRSYTAAAAAAQGSVSGGAGRSNAMLKKGGDESGKSATTSWIPDPVTGYYRPEGHVNEVDAAELRQMLLKNTARPH